MAYLTEQRFIELLNAEFDKKLKPIYDTLKKLEGFQKYEADAIEYELEMTLKKYIESKHPYFTAKPFPMNKLYDPYTNAEITELDAAFLLCPYQYNPDYDRLKEHNVAYPRRKIKHEVKNKFILAEAKHNINRNKIATKLWQFDRIVSMFQCAERVVNPVEGEIPVTTRFIATVRRNRWLAEPTDFVLLFGAACWEKGLMDDLQSDIKKRAELNRIFKNAHGRKKELYYKIRAIDEKWYTNTDRPDYSILPAVTDAEIEDLTHVDGAMVYVKLIHTSGDRFTIDADKTISGVTQYAIGGKSQTRKKSGSTDDIPDN